VAVRTAPVVKKKLEKKGSELAGNCSLGKRKPHTQHRKRAPSCCNIYALIDEGHFTLAKGTDTVQGLWGVTLNDSAFLEIGYCRTT
jgi:hypothetical protein